MALTKVSTDGVKDDAITKTKIPANQIETSELANSSVTLGKLFQGTAAGFIATSNGSDCTVPTFPSYNGDTFIIHDLQCQRDSSNVNPVIGAAGGGTTLTFRTDQNGLSGAGVASILDTTGLQLGRKNAHVKLVAPTDQSGQASYNFTFPPSGGSNGQFLKTDGNGTTSWDTVTGTTINNNADNRVITGSGTANTLNGEGNLTFDGNRMLTVSTDGHAYGTLNLDGNNGGLIQFEDNDSLIWEIYTNSTELSIYDRTVNAYSTKFKAGGNVEIENGNLKFNTAGKGIDFSATADGYTGTINETFDDYEEGYFTPTVGGWSASGTGVYGTGGQNGRYTKIGNTVTIFFHVYWTALNNASGVFAIENLPFAHSSSTYNLSTAVQMRYVDYTGDTVFAVGGNSYSSSLLFYAQNDNANHEYVGVDSNGGRIEGTVTYLTDS